LILNERRQGIITIVADILVDHPGNSSTLVGLWNRFPVEWKAGKPVSLVWLDGVPEGKVVGKPSASQPERGMIPVISPKNGRVYLPGVPLLSRTAPPWSGF
jgi:hypothetical protein